MKLAERTIITKIEKVDLDGKTNNSKLLTKEDTFLFDGNLESNKVTKTIISKAQENNQNVAIHYLLESKKVVYAFYPMKDFVFEIQKGTENAKVFTVTLAMRPTLTYLDSDNMDFEKIKKLLEESKKEKRKLLIAINPKSSFIEAVQEEK